MKNSSRKQEHELDSYRLKRSGRDYPATNRVKTDGGESYFLTAGVRRHSRYLSPLHEDVITYDASHHSAMGSRITSLNLTEIRIACDGGESVHKGVSPLPYFPNLCGALKLAINSALESAHAGDAHAAVSRCLRHSLRFFSWMMQNGIYRLADVTPGLLSRLIAEQATKGWAQLLQLDSRLLPILERARQDVAFARRMGGSESKGSSFGLNTTAIEFEIGTPVYPSDIRPEFRELLSRAAGNTKKITAQYKPFQLGTGRQLHSTMHTLNLLALHPVDHDSIPFFPFHNTLKSTKEACAAARVKQQSAAAAPDNVEQVETQPKPLGIPTQTPNLGVDAYFHLFSNALKWIYDYGPNIAELTEYAREVVIRGGPKTSNLDVRKKILFKYEELAGNGALPAKRIKSVNMTSSSWLALVKNLHFALFAMIGMNHGRRPNEIGGKKPYGMYYGCLKQISVEPSEHQIEFYVEKGPQDYRWFPANVLVADAVALLERLHLAMRRVDEPGGAPATNAGVDRLRHLFRSRRMTWEGLNAKEPSAGSFDDVKRTFFEISGVPYTEFEGRQIPFRRAFATLYVRRYDHPEGAALQDQLGHLDFGATVGYFTDLKQREPGKTILELHSKDAVNVSSMLEELHSASAEFLADLIVRMLKGEAMGGLFPYLVSKLTKRLSANVDFRSLTIERRAKKTAEILSGRGYLPHSMPHSACMAGSARHTRKSAKCFEEGLLRKDRASPTTCEGCVNSLTTSGNRQIVRQQTSVLQAQAQDSRCPKVVKLAVLREEKVQLDYLERDLNRAQLNSTMLKSLLERWPNTVGAALHGK